MMFQRPWWRIRDRRRHKLDLGTPLECRCDRVGGTAVLRDFGGIGAEVWNRLKPGIRVTGQHRREELELLRSCALTRS